MKTQLIFACLFTSVITSSFTTVNQTMQPSTQAVAKTFASPFTTFRIHRQGRAGIMSVWAVASESGITSFTVEKTYEDPADPYAVWEPVSLMPASGIRSYKCHDTNVFPGFISYRVTANHTNGNTSVSGINTIHIVSH